ncbi:MAG TPA: hypothetical protein VFM33_11285 [Aquabacterium sp.]|nr:hypothetical protein [Aquabacterium sp.]
MPTMDLRNIRAITASTLIGGVLLVACSPEHNWREIHPAETEGLTAWFPCKPEQQERVLSWPGVSQARVRVMSCRAGEAVWSLRYVTVPDAPQVIQTLQWWARDLQGRTGYTAKTLPTLQVPGATQEGQTAWQLDAIGEAGPFQHGQAWHFSHGLTVFQASVWQAKPFQIDSKEDDPVVTFKTGFQFSS